jgi:hypothetical protein
MELALHVRNFKEKKTVSALMRHLCGFYQEDLDLHGFDRLATFCRIYAGDEFCFHRLPTVDQMRRCCRFAEKHDANVTFLTPPMTNRHLKECASLFACLESDCPNAEVVVNDPGVLLYLKKNYPGLRPAAGRLFNKGFKDPRFTFPADAGLMSEAMRQALDDSTFNHEAFLDHLFKLGVSRIEQDIMPYASGINRRDRKMEVSVYFPFGYVTTGRICQVASETMRGREKFLISARCAGSCNHRTLELTHESFRFTLFQNGNTIYYLYPPAMLKDLFDKAADNSYRLVYQGFAL